MPLRSLQAICLMSFFLADVRDGLGPFLGIFLTQHQWQADDIGLVMSAGGIAGLLVTIPAGIVVDATLRKRLLIIAGCVLITAATLLLWFNHQAWAAGLSQVVTGISAAFIGPAVAGITLGVAGQVRFQSADGTKRSL